MYRCALTTSVLLVVLALARLAHADTFVHRKTGETVTGRFLGSVFKDGKQQFYVKTDDGKNRLLPESEWTRREDAPTDRKEDAKDTGDPDKQGGPVVDVDFGTDARSAAEGQVIEVVASGVGVDPEQAMQNAFSHAIEQAVGVLVDAETLVSNDKIVSEQVLTFSRGYVQHFGVVRRWEDGGLHYARIHAKVAVDKLVERLTAAKITTRPVPGELLYRQAKHEVATEKDAAAMFRKAMDDFRMAALLSVNIVGKPEVIEKDETHAKLRVRVTLTPNLNEWEKLRANLLPVLARVATKRSVLTSDRGEPKAAARPLGMSTHKGGRELLRRLGGEGVRVMLFRQINPTQTVTQWDAFLLPQSFVAVLQDVAERERKILRVALLDDAGSMLSQSTIRLYYDGAPLGLVRRTNCTEVGGDIAWYLGPLALTHHHYVPQVPLETTLELPVEKLRAVVKCAAFLEDEPAK